MAEGAVPCCTQCTGNLGELSHSLSAQRMSCVMTGLLRGVRKFEIDWTRLTVSWV